MGGGFFDNLWNPYNGASMYSRGQPRFRSYRPRAPVYEHYGPSMVPEDRASYGVEEPLNRKTVKTVKTIPVTDGGVPVAVPPKVSQAPVKAVVARFESEDAAATKIQAVYRGYVVRKTQPLQHLRVIRKVKEELENLKSKLQETEQRKKLCSDSQEKLRWSEGVMALLLRLDSLQGVHPEVRLIRKAMTKELIGFQETIDSVSTVPEELNGQDDVLSGENIDGSDVAEEGAKAIDAPEVVEEMGIEESASKELSGVEPDFASEGLVEEHCENDSGGEGMEGLVSEPTFTEPDAEVPMDVENKEQISTMLPAHRMEEGEVESASQHLPPTDVESDSQEASGEDNSAVIAPPGDGILEPIGFQETIDSVFTVPEELNGQDDVLTGENIDGSDVAEEGAKAIDAPEVVEATGIEESASKELSGVELESASEGPIEEHCENDSDDEGMEGLVSEPSSTEADAEVPMDVENEQISAMSSAHRMEKGELELASQNLPSTDVVSDNQEASGVDDSAVIALSRDGILEPISEDDASVAPAKNNDDAEMRDEAHDVGRREDTEMDMPQSGVNGVTGDNLDVSARLEEKEKETTASEYTDGVDGCIIPASTAMQSLSLEPQCVKSLQGGADDLNAMSDRALLLQVLEENRKLKDVVGKVLEWGKQQSDVIHDLTHRIAQLEDHQPVSNLLRGEDHNGRKRITNDVRPVDNMGRSRQRLEKGRRNRRQLSYIDPEDWLSAESDEYF